jgi:uncharacterized surface protein with fasciclin (FAS1) repeats
MFLKKPGSIFLIAVFITTAFITCTKKWDEHNQITDNALNNNLLQAIANTPGLSRFNELLIRSGYDKIISASKTYTVWAPTDIALQSLDPAIVADSARLKLFVGNHITNQTYLATSGSQRIKMLNGKYIVTGAGKFDTATIVSSNMYANNGVLHTIDKFIPRVDNTWEFVLKGAIAPQMRDFLVSLNQTVFDPTKAKQTGINPNTGEPVYDTASGAVIKNGFLQSAMDVSNEAEQYTMILLDNNAFTTELNKLTPWFKTSTADSTTKLAGFWLVRDLVFKGLINAAQLPDTIVSQFGVKVPVNKAAITASYKTSNGIVHVISKVDFKLADKFPPIIIQGESPTSFATGDRGSNTFYRVRTNPTNGRIFNDIFMSNYGYANYYINYAVKNLNSMRYNAFWVAVNDVQTTPLWQQRLASTYVRNDTAFSTFLNAVTIANNNYNEVLLGQFSYPNVTNRDFRVYGPATSSTTSNNNAITLDYIKLVPAF